MKFTLSWLKDHLETDASLSDILDALTDVGLEVESVSDPGARLDQFTLGYVKSVSAHPDADKLRVCEVQSSEGTVQIICGAPNAREGITAVVAKPGTYVSGIDKTIGVGKIRGIESFGMLCSERELELSDEHEGIIELSSGAVGETFTQWLLRNDPAKVDPSIEIAITPNRPDALGVRGIARDLAARGLGTLKNADVTPVQGTFECSISVAIDEDTRHACPVFYGREIRGVTNGPSPQWMQERLRAIGLRPISILVDITNYFTYDLARPLHVFDADKIEGSSLRIHRAAGGESIVGLDEKTYELSPEQTAISDQGGAQSIAGIMGGLATGCSETTTNVFLEAAYFDPVRTAYTGRALKINSDARYRFERGIDPTFTPIGLELATAMILEYAGGAPSDVVQAGEVPDVACSYRLDTARTQSLVGMDISPQRQVEILTSLGFCVIGEDAHVPPWRPDIKGEADLVEEIVRIESLSGLSGEPLARPAGVTKPILTKSQTRIDVGRRTAATLGYNECVTYSFIDEKSAAMFDGAGQEMALENPISTEMSHMRPSLLPGLLQAAARNQARGIADVALFEVGPIFAGPEPEDQSTCLSAVLLGHSTPKDVHAERRAFDLFDAKADAQAILGALGAPASARISRDCPSWWHPGRSGAIVLGKSVLAYFGEIHPKVTAAIGIKGRAVGLSIMLENIPAKKNKKTSRPPLTLSPYQAVERDFAFIVDHDVAADDLIKAAQGADKKLIESVRVFDEFIGDTLGDGKKSLAIAVRIQPIEQTLSEAEIESISQKVIENIAKSTRGVLREQ